MPFVTEEIYHNLSDRKPGDDCIIASFPSAEVVDSVLLDEFEVLKRLVTKVRDTRNANQLKPKEPLSLYVEQANTNFLTKPNIVSLVQKMAFVDKFEILDELPSNGSSFMSDNEKYFLQFEIEVNIEEERKRLQSELDYAKGLVLSVQKKLSNERFVQIAPEAVVNNERKKRADGEERVRILEESLAKLA
jgi:valyl-tRNA synthetase